MRQTPCLIRICRAEFVGEFRLSVKRQCFCLVIYNECPGLTDGGRVVRDFKLEPTAREVHIIYGKVYSLLKLTSKRAPFVVVFGDQECV